MDSKALKHVRKIVSILTTYLRDKKCRIISESNGKYRNHSRNILQIFRWKSTSATNPWQHRLFQVKIPVLHHLIPPRLLRKLQGGQFHRVFQQQLEQHHRQRQLPACNHPHMLGTLKVAGSPLNPLQIAQCPTNRPTRTTLERVQSVVALLLTHQTAMEAIHQKEVMVEVVHKVLETIIIRNIIRIIKT